MKKELASFIKFVVILLLLAYGAQWLLLSSYSYFVLHSSYSDFVNWYPKHHLFVYTASWLIKIAFFGGCLYMAKMLIGYAKDSYHLGAYYIQDVRAAMDQTVPININPKHYRVLAIAQISLLALVLLLYYALPHWANNIWFSRTYLLIAIFISIVFAGFNRKYVGNKLNSFFFEPTSAYNLGAYRICFFLFIMYRYAYCIRNYLPYIECKQRVALPYIDWVVHTLPISAHLYYIAAIAGVVTCVFLVMGLFTRFFLVINAFLVFYILAVPNFYGKLWHGQLPIWISWFLLFANVNGRLALDNYLFPNTKSNHLSPNHTFALRIIWLQIGFIYFWAGFHKLWQAGFHWALSQSMINQVRLEWFEHYDTYPIFRVDNYPTLLHIGGIAVIFFEMLFVFFLFSRHYKYISIIGGLIMHNVIGIFMYISFSSLQMQYIVFINYEKLSLWCKEKILGRKAIPVTAPEIRAGINKSLVYFSVGILSMNMLFGLGNISSYPFSVYPTYTEIVDSEKEYLHYEVVDANQKKIKVRNAGKQAGFRWEDFSRLDYAIINRYEQTGIVDTNAIEDSWKWWATKIDKLKAVDTLDVYIVRRSINPDSVSITLKKQYLLRMYPNQ